jgi:hypothetical protein
MCFGGGGSDDAAKAARQAEEARQGRINTGLNDINNIFAGFNDDFYAAREKSYLDYATPQLTDQYNDAFKNLTFALARAGQLNSSTGAQRLAKLRQQKDNAFADIVNQSHDYANQARGNVADTRTNLTNLLFSSANPSGVRDAAASQVASLSGTPAYNPVGPLFQNITAGLATAADAERRGYYGTGTGLFAPRGDPSVRYVR